MMIWECVVPTFLAQRMDATAGREAGFCYCASLVALSSDNTTYNVLDGERAMLPCNITAPSSDDAVSLVLWYKYETVLYTVDARSSASLESAQHFLHTDIEKRASFNLSYPLSFLRIKPIKSSDSGDYRCRVDFRRGRTVNRILKLTVIVPTKSVVIFDKNLQTIDKVAGPFDEDSSVSLICDASEGNPLPAVYWWKGAQRVDADYFVVNNSISRNVLTLANLTRDDLLMTLTCEAYNTNLTEAVSRTITLDLYLKPREIRIITPLQNISSSSFNHIELACQCTGSKPSASIQWRRGQDVLEQVSETISEDGLTTTSFVSLMPTWEDHGKNIECIGFNPNIANFTIQDIWPINIYYLPILSLIMGSNSHSQDIIEGSNVYFECNIKANPSVTRVGWKLNGHLLDSAATMPGIEIRNTSLLVSNVNHNHDHGKYECYAENRLGTSFSESLLLDVRYSPKCTHSRTMSIGVALGEIVTFECQVQANPSTVHFEWTTNRTGVPRVPLTYTSSGQSSVAKFVATSEEDYGLVQCFSQNGIGRQRNACSFQVIKAEPPSQPHNCTIVNRTANSLTLECMPGHAGGLEQLFHLQVYSLNPNKLLKNLSNHEAPYFAIKDLPAGYIFKLVIYSSNRRGKSKTIEITGSTTEASPWKSAEFESGDIYFELWPLAIVCGLIIMSLLLATAIFVKLRNRLKGRKRDMIFTEKGTFPRKSIMKKRRNNVSEGETIEISDLTFKPEYAPTTLSEFSQPYFVVPSPQELAIHKLQCSSKPDLATFSYDLCSSMAMIDVRPVN